MKEYDHSEVVNQILSLWQGETEQERYFRLRALRMGLHLELTRNRCAECEHITGGGVCSYYNAPIAEDDRYAENPCDKFSSDVPF